MKKNLKTFLWSRNFLLLLTLGWHTSLWAISPPEIRIVLDPGHGGKDFGSVYTGKKGKGHPFYEKNLVLDIAKETKKILHSPEYIGSLKKAMRVILTREKDIFLSLDKRATISKTHNAKIFVSIHANAEKTLTAHGMEIYLLDNASKESYSHHETLYKRRTVAEKRSSSLPLLLSSVTTDSMSLPSQLAAEKIGESLQQQLKKDGIKISYRGIKKTLLQVLLDVHVPSLLLEVAFISNENDRKLLRRKKTIHSIAKGLAMGILSHLESSERENYWTIFEEEEPSPLLHSQYPKNSQAL